MRDTVEPLKCYTLQDGAIEPPWCYSIQVGTLQGGKVEQVANNPPAISSRRYTVEGKKDKQIYKDLERKKMTITETKK